jgi:toxin-antitoxin system PIN domain toxin
MYLPDVNFWLALAFELHARHSSAKLWLDGQADDSCYFCRLTQQGFLRIANNPSMVFGAVAMSEAWRLFDVAMTDSRISFAPEPVATEAAWRNYAQHRAFSPKVWSDAYLAGFALAGGYEVVTFDRGFAQYAGLKLTILT